MAIGIAWHAALAVAATVGMHGVATAQGAASWAEPLAALMVVSFIGWLLVTLTQVIRSADETVDINQLLRQQRGQQRQRRVRQGIIIRR